MKLLRTERSMVVVLVVLAITAACIWSDMDAKDYVQLVGLIMTAYLTTKMVGTPKEQT